VQQMAKVNAAGHVVVACDEAFNTSLKEVSDPNDHLESPVYSKEGQFPTSILAPLKCRRFEQKCPEPRPQATRRNPPAVMPAQAGIRNKI